MLIYFDSVMVIYLIDHTGTFQARAAKLSKCSDILVEVLP
jgi:hypothetical protein